MVFYSLVAVGKKCMSLREKLFNNAKTGSIIPNALLGVPEKLCLS